MAPTSNSSESHFPLSGASSDGWTKEDSASATCFCGAVQIGFPTKEPGLVTTFVCHCYDCRKITASMFATNFAIQNERLTHVRGSDNLTAYSQSNSTTTGNTMTNYFCKTCGTLMYRVGPMGTFLRTGTVDDFHLHETALTPKSELFCKDRVKWLDAVEGVKQVQSMT
ncbi:hypothetical protein P280DRAFT_470592 [Massarina eburnea CBS 473.64]|uniref:CENP-V/GFA domain-containing protein n=1 Tax=Massarina eburnea CBS 473.64 TaxID=1395130 RepID=A0A6A6RVL7_9PLEO|nr:hypothetical protein P280DRAFT_470592 [Massarina eburnea CBS 473.64]